LTVRLKYSINNYLLIVLLGGALLVSGSIAVSATMSGGKKAKNRIFLLDHQPIYPAQGHIRR
jgi:hypothetical protein